MSDEVRHIRSSQSAVLTLKKHMYVEARKSAGLQKMSEISEATKAMLKESVAMFTEEIKVRDVDIYFCLLAYSSKQDYPTCTTQFERFCTQQSGAGSSQPGADGEKPLHYLNLHGWYKLCTRARVAIPDTVQNEIWKLLAWREKDKLFLNDFIAGFHVHDLSAKDPWVHRIAKVLKLEYYGMTEAELTSKISAKTHTVVESAPLGKDGVPMLTMGAGAGWQGRDSVLALEAGERKSGDIPGYDETARVTGYGEDHNGMMGGDDDAFEDSDMEVPSEDMSVSSMATDAEFDCAGFIWEEEDTQEEKVPEHDQPQFEVTDDATLQQLIWKPLEVVLPHRKRAAPPIVKKRTTVLKAHPKTLFAKRGPQAKKRRNVTEDAFRERRFDTDVHEVRATIRDVQRSVHSEGFLKLVNYVLRGLKTTDSDKDDEEVQKDRYPYYLWHAQDPTFLHTMGGGNNPYPFAMLREMGFVCLNEKYWVWPRKHLKRLKDTIDEEGGEAKIWGAAVLPQRAWASDSRLQDMITLFKEVKQRCFLADRTKRVAGDSSAQWGR